MSVTLSPETTSHPEILVMAPGRPSKQGPTKPLRAYEETKDKVLQVAGSMGLDMADFLELVLRPILDRYSAMSVNELVELAKTLQVHPSPKKKSPKA